MFLTFFHFHKKLLPGSTDLFISQVESHKTYSNSMDNTKTYTVPILRNFILGRVALIHSQISTAVMIYHQPTLTY